MLETLDRAIVLQIAVSFVSAVFIGALPILQQRRGVLAVSVVGLVVTFRQALPGYALANTLVYAFVASLELLARKRTVTDRIRWRFSCCAIALFVAAFLAGRYYQLNSQGISLWGTRWFLFSLDMWLVLRLVTFLWEFGSGRITRPAVANYALWSALPFTIYGPVIRYSQFEPQLLSLQSGNKSNRFSMSSWKGVGLACIQLLAALILARFWLGVSSGEIALSRWARAFVGFNVPPWQFYLLYAGYFALMESAALACGLRLPISFNRPFGRLNISEFWANWNMTATSVFRDYLFFNRWGLRRANAYVNTLVIFLLVGAWHGLNWYWITWGLLHGIGFCVFIAYRKSAGTTRFAMTGLSGIGARLFTYVFVCSCWILASKLVVAFASR